MQQRCSERFNPFTSFTDSKWCPQKTLSIHHQQVHRVVVEINADSRLIRNVVDSHFMLHPRGGPIHQDGMHFPEGVLL